jgi:hypothetical protein
MQSRLTSRLSDIALKWMLDELKEANDSVLIEETKLRTYPFANAIQHDEIVSTQNMWPKWIPWFIRRHMTWTRLPRIIDPQSDLHPSVAARFERLNVSQMGEAKPYRPENLKEHHSTVSYY